MSKRLGETRTFGTFTTSLEDLASWLKQAGVTHAAVESTSAYWKPVYNILEADFEILLVNGQHVKNVPGRKTDKADSRWLTKLLLSGLLKGPLMSMYCNTALKCRCFKPFRESVTKCCRYY